MNKKINRIEVRQTAQKAAIRDEQNRRIQFAATHPIQETLGYLNTTLCGLEPGKVEENRSEYGSNKVTREKKKTLPQRLAGAFINPFTAILFCLALVSSFTDMIFPHFSLFGCVPKDFDCLTVVIILTMVFLSGTLRFVQESRSGNAAEKLLAMITTTCTVTRKGQEMAEIPLDEVVVGDIVHLSAGDMLPADVRILDAKDLFVSQASLTGESEPIEKIPMVNETRDAITDYTNIAFMGSNVLSGSASAVVVTVGDHTLFGSMASEVAHEAVETSFSKGVNAVSWVLIRFMLVMVPLVLQTRSGCYGICGKWYYKRRLALCLFIWNFHCSWTDAGNAANDRNDLSCERCCVHEQEADDRQKSEFYSKFWTFYVQIKQEH